MAFLTTASVLDTTQTMISDQTAAMRARMLSWLNLIMQMVVNEPREWEFLKKSAALPITANVITLPADYSDFESLTVGAYFFTPRYMLTAAEEFQVTADGGTVPTGFVINEKTGTLTILPGTAETSATLAYKAGMPATDYTDGATATIFPAEFKPLFVRYLLTARNEFDEEDQLPISLKLSSGDMKTMKTLDNKRKAIPALNSHGYIRGQE